jgi:putative redox protein
LLSGLAACAGVDIVEILEKMRVPFADLTIEVESEQTKDHPRVFKTIHIKFIIKAEDENRDKIIKAIDLSLEKYCGVAAMLRKNSGIEYNLVIDSRSI